MKVNITVESEDTEKIVYAIYHAMSVAGEHLRDMPLKDWNGNTIGQMEVTSE